MRAHIEIFWFRYSILKLVRERLPRSVLTVDSDLSFENPILRFFRIFYLEISAGATRQAGSRAYRPKFVKHPMSTMFWETDLENWQTCSMDSCQPVAEWHFYVY